MKRLAKGSDFCRIVDAALGQTTRSLEGDLPATIEEFYASYDVSVSEKLVRTSYFAAARNQVRSAPANPVVADPALVPAVHAIIMLAAQPEDTYVPAEGYEVLRKFSAEQASAARTLLAQAGLLAVDKVPEKREVNPTNKFLAMLQNWALSPEIFPEASAFRRALVAEGSIKLRALPPSGMVWETLNLADAGLATIDTL
jgi:hypothetical protein